MLTPEDLKKKTFSKGFRGYETAEVDKFMQELIKEYNYLYLDNLQQKETIERVSSKLEYYQQMEATMQSTLTVAQETADEVKAASEKKAALLEQETKVKCEQQLAEAKAYVEELRRASQIEADKLRLSTEDMCKKRANSAAADANKLLDDARSEAGKMMLEANTKYRQIVGDAEEKSRKIIFDAESRASVAQQSYENQVKKSLLHCKNMQHLLETQLELVKNFTKQAEE